MKVGDEEGACNQCTNSAIKIMIGMGMPRNSNKSERIRALVRVKNYDAQASRRRPPKVAARLAKNAPINSDTKSHNAL